MKKFLVLTALMLCVILGLPAWAAGPMSGSFSADVVTTSPAGSHTSKMFVKEGKTRMEVNGQDHEVTTIMRTDKKVIWMLMPGQKMYMEMPFDQKKADISSKMSDPEVQVDKKFLGNETVEGHPTKKYHITLTKKGKKETSGYLWEATDMNNFPVKYQTEDRQITTVWKNVKMGGVNDSLFEVPAGYKKMSMPGGMGGFMMPRGGR